ncbi:hypothetical protein N431DRAFT_199695 [Stipitochalara longipes BDJ]|nr:hypothetical protein N431DRAFT_199695 [Stipitochalara longipes BDJ]
MKLCNPHRTHRTVNKHQGLSEFVAQRWSSKYHNLMNIQKKEENCGLKCSLNRGTFTGSKWLSDFKSPSSYGTLKMSSAPRR